MFISYIIPPFYSEAYLVRCLESLFAQTSDSYEVILAEHSFAGCSDYIEDALKNRQNFKVIEECGDDEKLAAAVKLIDPSAEFVQLVDAGMVAVPHALETIRSAADGADLLIPSTILRLSTGFVKRFKDGWENAEQFGALNACDYCFRRSLFDRYAENIIADIENVETLMDVLLGSGTPFRHIEDVCYYITKSGFEKAAITAEDYDRLPVISSNIAKEEIGSVKVKLFTKYVHRLTSVIDSDVTEYSEKCKAYEALRTFGQDAAEHEVLSRIFVLNTGVSAKDMKQLDLSGYLTLRSEQFRLSDTESSISAVNDIFQKYNVKHNEDAARMEKWIKSYNEERKVTAEENKKMREDIAALSANMHLLMQKIEKGGIGTAGAAPVSGFSNPVSEVPYLFATGKLGMKTIFKCISGWMRFKFGGKK